MRLSGVWAALAAAGCVALAAHDARAQLGALEPGGVSASSMGSTEEIVLNLTFNPTLADDLLPAGLRFLTLEEIAAHDDGVGAHLRTHPEQRTWATGFFEILRPESLHYDGYEASLGPEGGMAVWYAAVAREDRSDKRAKGRQYLALATWLSDRKLVARMNAKGYPAAFAGIRFRHDRSGRAVGEVAAGDVRIRGWCRPQGEPRRPDWGEAPHFQTVWTPRPRASTFEVITFSGHQQRTCNSADWDISGRHLLASAFRERARGVGEISGTEYYRGYVLRGSLYARR